ncbi:MAG: radical SAM protein [bacterium]|nr:radical SAM protein [bacterium]
MVVEQYDQVTNSRSPLSSELLFKTAEFLCVDKQPDTSNYKSLLQQFGDNSFIDDTYDNVYKKLILTRAITRNPTLPTKALPAETGLSLDEIKRGQKQLQNNRLFQSVLTSHYYPGYLFVQYAQSFLKNLADNPNYLENVAGHRLVAPKKLEIHATNASCNYRCEMCLWHVQNQGDYQPNIKQLTLLSADDWKNVLTQAKESGTDTIIFSGGGEPLLRPTVADVINHAKKLGLSTMIYTNGSSLTTLPFNNSLYQAILDSDWLRVSLHSTTEDRYSRLVNLPLESKPFSRVIKGIERLRTDIDIQRLPLKLGLGFVIQSLNYDQVEDITQLSSDLGLDFLNLRVDCIDITEKLTPEEEMQLYDQLRKVRRNLERGKYSQMSIDFADSLISPMNNWTIQPKIDFASDCRVHYYRSAIDPYGRVAVCDLTAEPFYSRDELTLGYITSSTDYRTVLTEIADKQFDAGLCTSCMPGQRAINALWHKVLEDRKIGIPPQDQPLLFKCQQ